MKSGQGMRNTSGNEFGDDARVISFIGISAILTVILVCVWVLAPPADIGVAEGQLAPNIISEAYSGGTWSDFELYDNIDMTWSEGDEGDWIFLLFIDTDCPHCYEAGDEHSNYYNQFGSDVKFFTISTELSIPGHSGSKTEIVDFRDKNPNNGCKSDKANCADRPGNPHDWPYIDDLNRDIADNYDLPGTPFYLLLSPDGIVAWNSGQNQGEDPGAAIQSIMGASA